MIPPVPTLTVQKKPIVTGEHAKPVKSGSLKPQMVVVMIAPTPAGIRLVKQNVMRVRTVYGMVYRQTIVKVVLCRNLPFQERRMILIHTLNAVDVQIEQW